MIEAAELPAGESARNQASGNAILIHIGYPKTASTWAQRVLFATPKCGFHNLFPNNFELKKLNEVMIGTPAFRFDPKSARALFDECIRKMSRDLVPVVSAESLVGNHYVPNQFDGKVLAERLRAVFPGQEARILLVIREQKSMILSRYAQYIRAGGWKSVDRFLDAFDPDDYPEWPAMWRSYILYDGIIAHYQALFGNDRVLVLPFEVLPSDPQEFVRRIVSFSGARFSGEMPSFENTKSRISGASIALRRCLNPFITIDRGNPFGTIMPEPVYFRYARMMRALDRKLLSRFSSRSERKLKMKIAALTKGYYGRSNRRTSELIGIDLARYGYDVS